MGRLFIVDYKVTNYLDCSLVVLINVLHIFQTTSLSLSTGKYVLAN